MKNGKKNTNFFFVENIIFCFCFFFSLQNTHTSALLVKPFERVRYLERNLVRLLCQFQRIRKRENRPDAQLIMQCILNENCLQTEFDCAHNQTEMLCILCSTYTNIHAHTSFFVFSRSRVFVGRCKSSKLVYIRVQSMYMQTYTYTQSVERKAELLLSVRLPSISLIHKCTNSHAHTNKTRHSFIFRNTVGSFTHNNTKQNAASSAPSR